MIDPDVGSVVVGQPADSRDRQLNAAELARDVDFVHDVVRRWWASKSLHETRDSVDTDAVFFEFRKNVGVLRNLSFWNFAVLLRDYLNRLGDGHLRAGDAPFESMARHTSGLHFALTEEGIAATNVHARLRGSRTESGFGDLVIKMDEQDANDYIRGVNINPGSTVRQRRWLAMQSLIYQERYPGESPSPNKVTLQTPGGLSYSVPLEWRRINDPPPRNICIRARRLPSGVGLLESYSFECKDELGQVSDAHFLAEATSAIETIIDSRTLIVDLRHNGGGRDQQARMLAQFLTDKPIPWMHYCHTGFHGEDSNAVSISDLEPAPHLYRWRHLQEIWLLIGPGCASSAEILVAALRAQGLVRLAGEPTAGSAGNPIEFRLPCSGLAFTVPVTHFFIPGTNVPLEGNGVAPDLHARTDLQNLRIGTDRVMATVLANRNCSESSAQYR